MDIGEDTFTERREDKKRRGGEKRRGEEEKRRGEKRRELTQCAKSELRNH